MQTTLSTGTDAHAGNRHLSAPEVYSLIRRDLELVEADLAGLLRSDLGIVDAVGRYLSEGGGKRIRPALLLLAGRLCGGAEGARPTIRMAAVMEMLHAATLVHDDIIDDAKMRRGRPSVNVTWGNEISVLMGDWLYMKAFEVTLEQRNFDVLDLLTQMTRSMTEGELIQLDVLGSLDITEEQHLEIVRRKTAYMFRSCVEIGALVAGCDARQREALAAYGLNAGIAFQLIDDVLDFVSTEDKLGKPVANDLREGKLTLPLIYLLEAGDASHRRTVETVVTEGAFQSVTRDDVLSLVVEQGTLERARVEARRYASLATAALAEFPDSEYRNALLSIPNFIVERDM